MENEPFEDVFRIEDADFPASHHLGLILFHLFTLGTPNRRIEGSLVPASCEIHSEPRSSWKKTSNFNMFFQGKWTCFLKVYTNLTKNG